MDPSRKSREPLETTAPPPSPRRPGVPSGAPTGRGARGRPGRRARPRSTGPACAPRAAIGAGGRWILPAGLLGLLLLVGCPEADRDGARDPAPARPPRIVSLAPVATRFVEALGAQDRLVALDGESRRRPGLDRLPEATLADALDFAPDLVLVGPIPLEDGAIRALQAAGVRVVELAPHDLEDVIALCRSLGAELAGREAADRFEHALSRPLALIGGLSSPVDRPRVAVLTELDPLTLAGGHSFESDLVEIAGGTSPTHGGEEHRLAITPEGLRALAPDLVLLALGHEPDAALRALARDRLPPGLESEFFTFDRAAFWLDEPAATAQRLHALLETRRSARTTSPIPVR